jgi:threonyl-tRNA synthetase
MAVVGEREAEAGTVAVRKRGAGKKQEVMDRASFAKLLMEEVGSRALPEKG